MATIMKLLGKMNKRTLVLSLALVLALATATGGTLAWLIDETEPVTNVFTYGDVNIDLEESPSDKDDGDDDPNTNEYQMVPGKDITKDPMVTVYANSEDCWLFVKIEESTNFDDFMTYTVADGWTELTGVEGVSGVYYRTVEASTSDQGFAVIKDNTVTVKGGVTKAQMDALATGTYPTLTVTAYACQYYKNNTATDDDAKGTPFTAAEAWTNVNTNATPNA